MKSCTSTFRRSRGARTTAMKEGTGARGGRAYASSAAERSNCGDAALASLFFFFVCIHKELWEIVLMHMDQGCYLHPWVGNTANPGNFSDFLTLVSLPEVDRTIRCRWLSRSAAWGYPTTLSPQSKAGCSTNSGNWHKNYHLHFTVEVQQADCSTSHKLYMGHWSWTASPAFSLFASFCLAWFTPLWSALLIPNVL